MQNSTRVVLGAFVWSFVGLALFSCSTNEPEYEQADQLEPVVKSEFEVKSEIREHHAGAAAGDKFAFDVDASGDRYIVGAYNADTSLGRAFIYENCNDSGCDEIELIPGDTLGMKYFGIAVAISGDYAIVGA